MPGRTRIDSNLSMYGFRGSLTSYWRLPMKAKVLALGVLLMAVPLFAHHGGASLYDMSKEVTVEATVTEFQWTNPHVELGMHAKYDKPKVRHWMIEGISSPALANKGRNRTSLRPGDVIKSTFNPSQ